MAFCIECGAKAPDAAKFCPQCGSALIEIEAISEPTPAPVTPEAETVDAPETVTETHNADVPEANDAAVDEEIEVENLTAAPAIVDAAPSVAASLAATANMVEDAPKSKAGLFIGLGALAIIAAGGGTYAMGLFGGGDENGKLAVSAPSVTTPTALPKTETVELKTDDNDTVLSAYKDAIKTGRISDLGQFAKDHPKNSLAKDAEDAAFASLKRQGSVLAFTAFMDYFPEADTSSYTGPRVNADEDTGSTKSDVIELDKPNASVPSVRTSITQRADELDSFITQGDTGYVLSVIDEMLSLADLNDTEATYLLNLRARAETSRGLIAPAQPALTQASSIESGVIRPASVDITPTPEPEIPVIAVAEPTAPILAYDTPAKAIDRFGAITPDEATEPGECDMTFSVSVSGALTNIIANCTDQLFIAPAKETVSEWTYSPALLAGTPVQQDKLAVKIKFHLE